MNKFIYFCIERDYYLNQFRIARIAGPSINYLISLYIIRFDFDSREFAFIKNRFDHHSLSKICKIFLDVDIDVDADVMMFILKHVNMPSDIIKLMDVDAVKKR